MMHGQKNYKLFDTTCSFIPQSL